ncbi:MAG: universal stress protein [Chloroflexota bacterium]|nr:MAG: universal stress protein [Chloroflexota bacterium]
MTQLSDIHYQLALRDFHRARQQAVMQQLLARFRGEGRGLLPFNEIEQHLVPTGETIDHGTQEIPLDKIVGSVSRYEDFTVSFLPKRDADQERWAELRAAMDDMVGVPPIEVYQIGDAYFVQDGNHRVSIARSMGSKTITAYVTEIKTRVPFSSEDDPSRIVCKTHYADFLEQTNLDKLRPDADLMMTFCGQYQYLLDQIAARQDAPIRDGDVAGGADGWEQAVVVWYDQVYLPVIQIIRELGILHHFPDRKEADMYVLLSERRDELELQLGWHVEMESGVSELIVDPDEGPGLFGRVKNLIIPRQADEQEPGLWRQQQLARGRYHHLFKHILVALDGTEENWRTFDNYLRFNFDEDFFHGLHVVADQATIDSDHIRQMQDRFVGAIERAGMKGEFAVEISHNPVQVINKRAAWVDVVLVRGNRTPSSQPLDSISSELRLLVQECPRPILVTPDGSSSDFSRAILAYDGSPKADEALFIATYLASRWQKLLTVVTVETAYTTPATMERARQYLVEHGVAEVNYVLRKGPITELVLETAEENDCNLLIMGGFGFRSLRQLTLGSSAEDLLREFPHPMWVCR